MTGLRSQRSFVSAVWLALGGLACAVTAQTQATLTVYPDQIRDRIDERIYGQFLEHIYHSVNGGLWGQMIWNGGFEESLGEGAAYFADHVTVDEECRDHVLLVGEPWWRDYHYTLEVRKLSGSDGVVIPFRSKGQRTFYWCRLGSVEAPQCCVEKGFGASRIRVVGRSVPGALEAGRWYGVRIRCQGSRIQAWLDDQPLLDVTDDVGPYLEGQAGIGVLDGEAEFRDLRVTTLDGQVLFEGLPQPRPQDLTPRHWQAVGSGTVRLENTEVFNSDRCLYLAADKGRAGIRQGGLEVTEGRTYRGSLWIRGGTARGMTVYLMDGSRVLADQTILPRSVRWNEYPLELRPNGSSSNATLEIGLDSGDQVWVDQVSLMSDATIQAGGFQPNLLRVLADLRPAILRWPGGMFVQWYRWKDGIGPLRCRRVYPRFAWDDLDTNAFGIDEYIQLCRILRAEPVIVVNMGTMLPDANEDRKALLQDALDLVDYCNGPADGPWGSKRVQNGHSEPYHVMYWEMGNPQSFKGFNAYLDMVKEWAPAMKAACPYIQLIAGGEYLTDLRSSEKNDRLIDQCAHLIDYLSLECYDDNDRFAQGPVDCEAFLDGLRQRIRRSANPDLKIYVCEWNTWNRGWSSGLYAAGLLNVFERNSDLVRMASPAILIRHVNTPRAMDNALINFDQTGWFPGACYVLEKLWRDFYAPYRIVCSGDTGILNGVATRSEDGRWIYIKTVNPRARSVYVRLTVSSDRSATQAGLWEIHGSPEIRNAMGYPNQLTPHYRVLTPLDRTVGVDLPAYSACVLTIRLEQ